jgi:hypothetical protein
MNETSSPISMMSGRANGPNSVLMRIPSNMSNRTDPIGTILHFAQLNACRHDNGDSDWGWEHAFFGFFGVACFEASANCPSSSPFRTARTATTRPANRSSARFAAVSPSVSCSLGGHVVALLGAHGPEVDLVRSTPDGRLAAAVLEELRWREKGAHGAPPSRSSAR